MCGRLSRLVPIASIALITMALVASPARAQNWFENLFQSGQPKASAETEPAPSAPSTPPSHPQQDNRPAAAKAPSAQTRAVPKQAKPVVSASPAAPATPLTPSQIVEKANAYLNGLSTLTGDFTQIGDDGRKLTGRLYLSRPGRVRFEYDAPATLEIIADGTAVAIRDRKLATQDLYMIGQTPLKFLLSDRIDLTRDLTVTGVAPGAEEVHVLMEDRSILGGTSQITLAFDPAIKALSRWRVVDPQGSLTTVILSNVERGRGIDPRLFAISYQRADASPR